MESKIVNKHSKKKVAEGLKALLDACGQLYLYDPLHFSHKRKYWQGGPCPLDLILVYPNPGNPDIDIAPHWLYIGFGLSDLYGDGRLHEKSRNNTCSGYGFELTFRLKRNPGERKAPLWPRSAMQTVAKCCFKLKKIFCVGDYVIFKIPLEKGKFSRIQHLLFSEDPQLGTVQTPFGPVTFLQMVGVCEEELEVARRGEGQDVVKLMKSVKEAGGPLLITDMSRDKTVFELDSVQEAVKPCSTFFDSWLPWSSDCATTVLKKNK